MTEISIDIVLNRLCKMQTDPKYFIQFEPPCKKEKIMQFEQKYRIKLPQSYKKFLQKFNGGMMLYFFRNEFQLKHSDYEKYRSESIYFLSIEELLAKYADLKDREWKVDKEMANPYPIIPFCSLPNNELLVFVQGEKSGNESPVFDAFHEEFPSTWGILAPNFTSFLSDYLDTLGHPKKIGDEGKWVASDYFDKPREIKETPKEILERTESDLLDRPDHAFSYYERASAFKDLNRLSDAWLAINKAIELSPEDAFYYFNRGEILTDAQQHRTALIDFDIAVKLAPKDTFYLCCRAGSLFQLNKLKPALNDCNTAIELDSKYILPYMMRKEIYLLMGMKDKAEADQVIIDQLSEKSN